MVRSISTLINISLPISSKHLMVILLLLESRILNKIYLDVMGGRRALVHETVLSLIDGYGI